MFSKAVFLLLLLAMLQWNDWVDLRGLHKALIAQLVSSRGKERGKKRGRDGGGMLEEGGDGATFNELPMLRRRFLSFCNLLMLKVTWLCPTINLTLNYGWYRFLSTKSICANWYQIRTKIFEWTVFLRNNLISFSFLGGGCFRQVVRIGHGCRVRNCRTDKPSSKPRGGFSYASAHNLTTAISY